MKIYPSYADRNDEKKAIDVKVIATFNVLYHGWECDTQAWLVEFPDGRMETVGTSHGSIPYVNTMEMWEKVQEYADALKATVEALTLVEKSKKPKGR